MNIPRTQLNCIFQGQNPLEEGAKFQSKTAGSFRLLSDFMDGSTFNPDSSNLKALHCHLLNLHQTAVQQVLSDRDLLLLLHHFLVHPSIRLVALVKPHILPTLR